MSTTTEPTLAPPTTRFECPPDHKHASTSTCYTSHLCRCVPCGAASTARKNERARLLAYGRWDRGRVSAAHATVHVLVLHHLDAGTLIDGRGARRRLQALACHGWTIAALATRLGLTREALSARVHCATVTVATHRALDELYEQLWDRRPVPDVDVPAGMIVRTERRARARGWVPPLAWDDIDADPEPPTASVDGEVDSVAVDLAVAGYPQTLTIVERRIAVARLHRLELNDREISEHLGMNVKAVAADREHLGLRPNYRAEAVAA